MQYDYYKPRTYHSKAANITLELIDMVEPNYGRMVWQYRLYFDGKLADDKYNQYSKYGPYLHPDLEKFEFESKDGKHIFMPMEDSNLIYNTVTKSYKEYYGFGRGFLKNIFEDDKLLILKKELITIINLRNYDAMNIQFKRDIQLLDIDYTTNQNLVVTYKDLTNYKDHTKRYDFTKMDFAD